MSMMLSSLNNECLNNEIKMTRGAITRYFKTLPRYIGLFIIASLFFLHSKGIAKDVYVSEKDQGGTISLDIGDQLKIRLHGNLTTGYTWKMISDGKDCLKFDHHSFMPFRICAGSGGIFTFTFQAVAKGASTVSLNYLRPWEKNVPVARSFTINVTVSENEKTLSQKSR
jgi:inhibitor of cysteine peptidase